MPFAPGQSGNPAGRKVGIVDRRSRWSRYVTEDDEAAIIGKIVELAKAGDPIAMRIAADRISPSLRAESQRRPINLQPGETIEALGRGVVAAIAEGDLGTDEGAALLSGLARQAEMEKLGLLADVVAKLAADRGIEVPAELRIRQRVPATINGTKAPEA